MALVDLKSEQIYGCKKGSKVWHHEKAHILFNKTAWGIKINYYSYFFMMVAVFILSLSIIIDWLPLKLFGFLNALGMVLMYSFEEVWCWVVGLKDFRKLLKGGIKNKNG